MYQFVQNISIFLTRNGFSANQLYLFGLLIGTLVASNLFFLRSLLRFFFTWVGSHTRSDRTPLYLDVVEKATTELIIFNGIYYALLVCPISGAIKVAFTIAYLFVTIIYLVSVARAITINSVKIYLTARGVSEEAIATAINFVRIFSTVILWIIAIIIFLLIMKVDIAGLLSGLGVASIIVAFAFQNILKDILAFFTVYIDRSFAVGDFVTFDKYEGTIKEIRLRTTRIKALLGNELIVPNDQLTSGVIQNYNRFQKRRISFSFKTKVVTADKVEAAIADIKDLFAKEIFGDRVTLNSCTFSQISDYGLELRLIYRFTYIRGESNFYQHLDKKSEINLAVLRVLKSHDIPLTQLEYPTQTT